MKKLIINGDLHVNGKCSGKYITSHGKIENDDDSIVINGNVTIDGDLEINDNQSVFVTGELSCTE